MNTAQLNFCDEKLVCDMRTPEYSFVNKIIKRTNKDAVVNMMNFFTEVLSGDGDGSIDITGSGLPKNMVVGYYMKLSQEILSSDFPGVMFYNEFIMSRPDLASSIVNCYNRYIHEEKEKEV